jgi:hypothetical protein
MQRRITAREGAVSGVLKLAAALFAVYGLGAFLNAAVVLRNAGWASPLGWVRALIQLVGAGLVAWGLLRGARWSRGLGLVLGLFWLVTGALTMLVVEGGDLHWLPPSGFQLLLTVALVCLGVAVALLLTPLARAALRRPAG